MVEPRKPVYQKSQAAPRKFRSIAAAFLNQRCRMFPQHASELGLSNFDGELGQNDAAFHRTYGDILHSTLRDIEALPDIAFVGDDWLDRRGMLAMLRTDRLNQVNLEIWRSNPQVHCDAAVQSIFGLVSRNASRLGNVLPAIEQRLEQLPRFLRQGASVVRNPVPLWTSLARQTCQGADLFLSGITGALLPLSRRPAYTEDLLLKARVAFESFARAISNKTSGVGDGFSIGRENFELLTRERLGLDYSLPEIEAIGRDLVEHFKKELNHECVKFGRRSPREIIEAAAAAWKPASESLTAEYERTTAEVRAKFDQKGLVTMPVKERLDVMLVPEFLKHHFPTAAYHRPGPFARKQHGIFWVNDLSTGIADLWRREAEVRQHFGIELTCAHEGYPGHHVQFVIQNRHSSRLRRHFAHAIFYEGWTLWCEKMCVEYGIWESPYARLIQLNDALWRAFRIVIDCGLHSGELRYRGACRKLVEGVGFTSKRAQADVNWYTSSPTVPMSYLLGYLELEKLHREHVGIGGATIREFNDWILGFGALPWSWIRRSGFGRKTTS
jgi:hypothetical protein